MKKILLALAAVALLSSGALAGGRAFCRAELGGASPFSVRCTVEQTLFALGPLETAAGVSARFEPGREPAAVFTPYTAILLFLPGFWLELNLTGWIPTSGPVGFGFAIAGGIRW